jgi:hypothetical protein
MHGRVLLRGLCRGGAGAAHLPAARHQRRVHQGCHPGVRTLRSARGHREHPDPVRDPREWATHMRAILTRSTGYDHVRTFLDDTGSRLPAGYLPLYCSRAVAEQALLLWLGLMRRIRDQTDHLPRFERDGLTGMECQGRSLVVVGVGSIGHEVCRIGRGLGMRVIGVDIVQRHGDVEYLSRDEAIPLADVIVCAMNLTRREPRLLLRGGPEHGQAGGYLREHRPGRVRPEQDLLKLLHEAAWQGWGSMSTRTRRHWPRRCGPDRRNPRTRPGPCWPWRGTRGPSSRPTTPSTQQSPWAQGPAERPAGGALPASRGIHLERAFLKAGRVSPCTPR